MHKAEVDLTPAAAVVDLTPANSGPVLVPVGNDGGYYWPQTDYKNKLLTWKPSRPGMAAPPPPFYIGGDDEQAEFLAGKAWDGKAFYTPAPVVDIEAERRAALARVNERTAAAIVGGVWSGGVFYDSDVETQLTMNNIRCCVDIDRFSVEWPDGVPVRGRDTVDGPKTVHRLDADGVKTFIADLAAHIGACKIAGWKEQNAVKAAETVEEIRQAGNGAGVKNE